MVNNWTHSRDRISSPLKHKTKHLDKTFKKFYQKIKHKYVKRTIANSPRVCKIHLKKLSGQKSHKNVNFVIKNCNLVTKKSQNCKFVL